MSGLIDVTLSGGDTVTYKVEDEIPTITITGDGYVVRIRPAQPISPDVRAVADLFAEAAEEWHIRMITESQRTSRQ
jgi:hypothetical protein